MGSPHRRRRYDQAFHNRQTRGTKNFLAALFVHRKGRGQHAGVCVRQAHPFQQSLNAAVFAPAAMQTIQNDIGLSSAQIGTKVGAAIDLDDFETPVPQSRCAGAPC